MTLELLIHLRVTAMHLTPNLAVFLFLVLYVSSTYPGPRTNTDKKNYCLYFTS